MYSKVLDQQTYAAVIAAAPQIIEATEQTARRIVATLARELTVPEHARLVDSQQAYLELSVKALVDLLDGQMTPKLVGAVVRDLGLRTTRKPDGYYVQWNESQVKILRGYLGV